MTAFSFLGGLCLWIMKAGWCELNA